MMGDPTLANTSCVNDTGARDTRVFEWSVLDQAAARQLIDPSLNPADQVILDNWNNFRKANWTRSGVVEGVPEELVGRLVRGLSSAGGMESMEEEVERFRQFKAAGLTELSLRLHDDPLEALQLIGEHVLPAVR